jgi:hypothetical protein
LSVPRENATAPLPVSDRLSASAPRRKKIFSLTRVAGFRGMLWPL